MLEVEVKVRLDDPEALRKVITKLGGRERPAEEHRDTYFLHPARDFLETDEALRVRVNNGKFEVTYKGPRQGIGAKIREELNLPIGEDPTPLLVALGFQPSSRLEKRRERWALEGTQVCLDTLSFGTFAEVEVLAENAAKASDLVEAALAAMGLAHEERLLESYVELSQN